MPKTRTFDRSYTEESRVSVINSSIYKVVRITYCDGGVTLDAWKLNRGASYSWHTHNLQDWTMVHAWSFEPEGVAS